MRPGVERTRQNVQELGATRAKDKRVKSITDTGRINMVKWMVIIEEVRHVSYVIDADTPNSARLKLSEVLVNKPWHATVDTQQVIAIMPMEKDDEAK
jgi:hypothetical protein